MNERIKELITQCSFTVTEYSMGIDNSYEDFDKELFAEFIVRDVVATVKRTQETSPDFEWAILNNYDFGVKE